MTNANLTTGTGFGRQETYNYQSRESEERRKFLAVLLADVLSGLKEEQKTLPCKYLYDSRGSEIFDKICDLPEYYPTRTEIGILRRHLPEISKMIGRGAQVVEYGSGSGLKTRLLLESLDEATGCALVEISRSHLATCTKKMQQEFPGLKISALCADYTRRVKLPEPPTGTSRKIVFFPGSTIGNFDPAQAQSFMRAMAESVGRGGALLIGVDLQKDRAILEPAYDDKAGVTAAFNLNLLRRINKDLGADFRLENFTHRAPYNIGLGRMEMHLVSKCHQNVRVAGRTFGFAPGETIHTESSYKYTLAGFKKLAAATGWNVERVWMDDNKLFSVQYLTVAER